MNYILGLENWLEDTNVNVGVHIGDPENSETAPTVTEDTSADTETDTSLEPTEDDIGAESEEDTSDENSSSDEKDLKFLDREIDFRLYQYHVVADKCRELNRLYEYVKTEGLNRSIVKLYGPKFFSTVLGLRMPALESIDQVTSPREILSQEAIGSLGEAAKSAGGMLKNAGVKVWEAIKKFIAFIKEKITEFTVSFDKLDKQAKNIKLKSDVDVNFKLKNVFKAAKQLEIESGLNPGGSNNEADKPDEVTVETVFFDVTKNNVINSLKNSLNHCKERLAEFEKKIAAAKSSTQASEGESEGKNVQAQVQEDKQKIKDIMSRIFAQGKFIKTFMSKYCEPK